jgi:cytochrome c
MKRGTTIAALVTAAVLAGHAVSAQVANSPPPLSQVPIPKPDKLGDYVKNEQAAIALGKSLFWDMQLGSDGIQSCASCHFHAGADNRSKNQLNPGQDNIFNIGGGPNYQLTVADFPFHKLADTNDIKSAVLSDSNDVTGSQGVFRSDFVDVVPGSD